MLDFSVAFKAHDTNRYPRANISSNAYMAHRLSLMWLLLQLSDIKLYLKSHDRVIAKTQVPITALPLLAGHGTTVTSPDDAASSGVGSSSPPPSARISQDPLGSRALDVLGGEGDDTYYCTPKSNITSMPSTPRGTSECGL